MHYFVALAAVVVAAWVRFLLGGVLGQDAPLLLFTLAVVVAGWWGGLKPGLLATAAGLVIGLLLFVEPGGGVLPVKPSDQLRAVLFVGIGVAVSWLCESLHAARRRLVITTTADERAWKARYEAAVESSGSVLYDYEYAARRATFGGSTEALLGMPAQQMPKDFDAFLELVHPDDRTTFAAAAQASQAEGGAFSMAYRLRRSDGGYVAVQDDGKVIRAQGGPPVRIVGLLKDVSEQLRTSAALRATSQQLLLSLSVGRAAAFTWDIPADEVRILSDGIVSSLGVTADQPNTFDAVVAKVHPDDRSVFEQRVRHAVERPGRDYTNEYRRLWPDGSWRWISDTGQVEFGADGRALRLIGLATDITGRKHAAAQLHDSEERLRTIADATPDLIFVKDTDCRLTFANPATLAVLGLTAQQAIGREASELYTDPSEGKAITANDRRIMAAGVTESVEELFTGPQGTRTFLSTKTALRDGSGAVVGIVGVTRDITERKRIEANLRQREAFISGVLGSITDGVYSLSKDWRFTFVNDEMAHRFGRPQHEIVGGHIWQMFPDAVGNEAYVGLQRAMAERTPVTYEVFYPPSQRWFFGSAYPAADGGLAVFTRDITVDKQAEQALQVSEEFNRSLMDGSPDCMKVLDSEGRLLHINAPGLCLMGIDDAAPLYVQAWADIWPAGARQDIQRAVATAGGGNNCAFEAFCPTAKGAPKWWDVSVSPIRDGAGRVVRLLVVSRDITARKQADALQNGQRLVLEMVATAQPLPDVLRALCELVEQQEPDLLCSVLLPDEAQQRVGMAVAPNLPEAYRRGLEGLPIGPPYIGACGVVLNAGEAVVVPDAQADERFAPEWRGLLAANGLRACRSTPVWGHDGSVLASFAIYRREAGDPTPSNAQLLPTATHLAGIAIGRAKAAAGRQRAEAQYRNIVEGNAALICRIRPDGRLTFVNDTYCRTFNRSRESLVGHHFTPLVPDADRPAIARLLERLAPDMAPYTHEHRVVLPDGQTRWQRWTNKPVADTAGEGIEYLGIGFDITDRKRAEESSRLLSEAAVALLVTDEPDAMLQGLFARIGPPFGLDMYFNYMADPEHEDLRLASAVGIADEQRETFTRLAYGQAVCGSVAASRTPHHARHIQHSDDPKVQALKCIGVRAYVCHPLVSGSVLLGTLAFGSRSKDSFASDELEFLHTICNYVTAAYERLRLVNQLRETDRRKNEFLATLAHELRNPLAPIRNGLQIMKLAGGNVALLDQTRLMMERQVGQMAHLIDDLMDLSRISQGKFMLQKTRFKVADAVQDAVDIARQLIEAQCHELVVDLPPEPLYVDADRTRLAQVFGNLLNNAAKYTPTGGRIRVAVERRGGAVVVAVEDNGVGIPAHMLNRVFDMFAQVDRSLEKSQGGLGIGLNIVKRLVAMHDGSIAAESGGDDQGSRFTVHLPVALCVVVGGKPDDPDATFDEMVKPAARRRILVADDSEDGANSLAEMLNIMGCETQTAFDGIEAVAVAQRFEPDVILMDIGMPGLNGYEACRRIRDKPWGRKIVIVAQTGWGQENDKRKSHEAGFDLHMVKPIDPGALEKLLAGLKPTTA